MPRLSYSGELPSPAACADPLNQQRYSPTHVSSSRYDSRNLYNIGGIINNIIVPRMLNPESWNWGAKSGLFWAGVNALLIVWCYFRLPEPMGRTYGGKSGVTSWMHRRRRRGPSDSPLAYLMHRADRLICLNLPPLSFPLQNSMSSSRTESLPGSSTRPLVTNSSATPVSSSPRLARSSSRTSPSTFTESSGYSPGLGRGSSSWDEANGETFCSYLDCSRRFSTSPSLAVVPFAKQAQDHNLVIFLFTTRARM